MKPKLSERKKRQVNRIIADSRKMYRFRDMADRRGNALKRFVLKANVGGRNRVIKISENEALQRKNLLLLQREHTKAVRNGSIKPSYSLSIAKYVHIGPEVSVMEKVPGFGTNSLKKVLLLIKKANKKALSMKQFQPILRFIKSHPEITLKTIDALEIQLRKNLKKVSKDRKRFSYDVDGVNNILVKGFDRKTGKFKVTLVDQVFPYDNLEHVNKAVDRMLAKLDLHSQ